MTDLGFSYRATKNGDVMISRNGKRVTTLRGLKAVSFIEEMDASDHFEQQQLMARLTGNYKRGNERLSKNHPRNRR